jgi:hypothetical protein
MAHGPWQPTHHGSCPEASGASRRSPQGSLGAKPAHREAARAAGRTRELYLSITGSGDVRAGRLAAERGSTEVIGSGDAEVNYTTDQVTTTVVGSGNLKRVGPSDRKE